MLKPGYAQLGEVVTDNPMGDLYDAQGEPEPTVRKHTAKIIEDPDNTISVPGILGGQI